MVTYKGQLYTRYIAVAEYPMTQQAKTRATAVKEACYEGQRKMGRSDIHVAAVHAFPLYRVNNAWRVQVVLIWAVAATNTTEAKAAARDTLHSMFTYRVAEELALDVTDFEVRIDTGKLDDMNKAVLPL